MGFYSSPSKISAFKKFLNFIKIRWQITKILGSKVLGGTLIPGYQKLSWSDVVMDFQIIVEAFVSIIF
jgi:hypothetical protein